MEISTALWKAVEIFLWSGKIPLFSTVFTGIVVEKAVENVDNSRSAKPEHNYEIIYVNHRTIEIPADPHGPAGFVTVFTF